MAALVTSTPVTAEPETEEKDEFLFPIQLTNLTGVDPINVQFNSNFTVKDMTQKLEKIMKMEKIIGEKTTFDFSSRFTTDNKVPKSYPITVGEDDTIDFAGNEFKISPTTRYIQYWNDFLDEAKLYDEEQKTDQTEGEISYDGTLSVLLERNTLKIGDAKIDFQRTLRIPDDDKTYPLPPGLGKIPIEKVQDYMDSDGLPSHWKKRKGVIIPMLSICP